MNDMLQVIINGLTYEGQTLHIIINYALILLVVMPFLLIYNQAQEKKAVHGWDAWPLLSLSKLLCGLQHELWGYQWSECPLFGV